MTLESFKKIKSPKEYKDKYALRQEDVDFIINSRREICSSLFETGTGQKLLVVLGPCSIHDEGSALEYAEKIKQLQNEVGDQLLLVMRFYFEKPRTKTGWKGLLYDPYINDICDLETGIDVTRRLMHEITRMKVPLASELVDPICLHYFNDIISWLCIGARTSSSQVHRQMASGLNIPIGFKNDLSGSTLNAIYSLIATASSHTYLAIDDEGDVVACRSRGANFSHLVLRGSLGKPNYYPEQIKEILTELENNGLFKTVMVDCSHENCGKNHQNIPNVFSNVIEQINNGSDCIRGLMLESHLLPGNQPFVYGGTKIDPNISITDPCLGWTETKELIKWANKQLEKRLTRLH